MLRDAIDIATKSGNLALQYSTKPQKVSYKPDDSPVTPADLAVEKLARNIITKKYPDHGIIGEEFENVNPRSKYQWIIDPIDGTRDYSRNIPLWATLIAVMENKKPIIGIIYFPYSKEIFSAQKSNGAFLNGKSIKVSANKDLSKAFICHNSIKNFEYAKKLKGLVKLASSVQTTRSTSTFDFNLFFKGKTDAVIHQNGFVYDFAAPGIITKEAGGRFSDFSGKYSLNSGNSIFTNGHLHKQVINFLNS